MTLTVVEPDYEILIITLTALDPNALNSYGSEIH